MRQMLALYTNMIKALAIITLIFSFSAKAENLVDWLSENNPIVINYLTSLSDSNLGQAVQGVRLSDGSYELKGYQYLGRIINEANKSYVYVFRTLKFGYVAYIWVATNGRPLTLPARCKEPDSNFAYPGWSGAVLSGDSYTYNVVQPKNEIVTTHCLKMEWLSHVGV